MRKKIKNYQLNFLEVDAELQYQAMFWLKEQIKLIKKQIEENEKQPWLETYNENKISLENRLSYLRKKGSFEVKNLENFEKKINSIAAEQTICKLIKLKKKNNPISL